MIHINYTLTQKDYKKYYIQTMTLGYMKIYVVVLALAMIITKLLGMALASEGLQSTATSLFVTFIPTLFLCLGLSIMVSYFDLKKALKNHPETSQGTFKLRFEKSFIIWQIDGKNHKLNYDSYTVRKGFKNTVVLTHPQQKNIVIPQSILTKEQISQIKQNTRG